MLSISFHKTCCSQISSGIEKVCPYGYDSLPAFYNETQSSSTNTERNTSVFHTPQHSFRRSLRTAQNSNEDHPRTFLAAQNSLDAHYRRLTYLRLPESNAHLHRQISTSTAAETSPAAPFSPIPSSALFFSAECKQTNADELREFSVNRRSRLRGKAKESTSSAEVKNEMNPVINELNETNNDEL